MEKEILSRKVYSWSWQAENGNVSIVFLPLWSASYLKLRQHNGKMNIHIIQRQVQATNILCDPADNRQQSE